MKKSRILILSLLLIAFIIPCAQAGGLSGLMGGNGAGGINGLIQQEDKLLPDPAEITDEMGTLLQENYEFLAGYFCTAYSYPAPTSVNRFISDYTALARTAGYSVTAATVDGANGYSIQKGDGKTAYLIPGIQGQMLFLVENGMAYAPKERTNYMTVTYNGRVCEFELQSSNMPNLATGRDYYDTFYHAANAPIDSLGLDIPKYAATGDEFYMTRSNVVEGFRLSKDTTDYLAWDSQYHGRQDHLKGDKDYILVRIDFAGEVDGEFTISGTWEGKFNNGKEVYSDGQFHAVVPYASY